MPQLAGCQHRSPNGNAAGASTVQHKSRPAHPPRSASPAPQIHWFSIVNSCVTVLLLTGFLATILMRVLKNDFVKYSRDDEALEDQEETGGRSGRGWAEWAGAGRPGGY